MKYNKSFYNLLLGIVTLLTHAAFGQSKSKGPAIKPNVIVIYSDDQGAMDLNVYGSKDLTTPNLDRLAHNGVRFTKFYSA